MHPPTALLPSWLEPTQLLDMLGPWALWGALAIVFAETGLLIGFFLPGDSLLFTVGMLVAGGQITMPLPAVCAILAAGAFVGNVVGYEIGYHAGPAIFRNEDSKIFRKSHVDKTTDFFERYGPKAIVLARFVPIVRTFITVTAGVGRMDRKRFLAYSGIGGVLWAAGVTVIGYYLGSITVIQENIELMLLAIVLVSVIPVAVEFLRERGKAAKQSRGPGGGASGPVGASRSARHAGGR